MMDEKLYEVRVNGMEVATVEDGFNWNDGELLWQAMSEQSRELDINGVSDTEDRLADWEDLNDDDIESLLKDAKEQGFIEDYEINELD